MTEEEMQQVVAEAKQRQAEADSYVQRAEQFMQAYRRARQVDRFGVPILLLCGAVIGIVAFKIAMGMP